MAQNRLAPDIISEKEMFGGDNAPDVITEKEMFDSMDEQDLSDVTNILYGEGANDPKGLTSLLNTYSKARRKDESLANAMKRKSSAYRKNDPQYKKASTGDLNAFEQSVHGNIRKTVEEFKPDESWPYTFHENLDIYPSEKETYVRLDKAWGRDYNKASAKKIGRQTYFAPPSTKTKQAIPETLTNEQMETPEDTRILKTPRGDIELVELELQKRLKRGLEKFTRPY